jgi:hypothetical protein
VGVIVDAFQAGLMRVLMGMFGPVGVGVGVLVFDVVMLVRGVCMRVGDLAVLVFMRVLRFVAVLIGHWCHLLCEICCVSGSFTECCGAVGSAVTMIR